MKKILFIISTLMFCVSCQKDIKGNIESSFKEYAQKNFNDPTTVESIADVVYNDTLSPEICAKMVRDVVQMSNAQDSLRNSLTEKVTSLTNKNGKKVRKNNDFVNAYRKYHKALNYWKDGLQDMLPVILLGEFLTEDSISKMKDFNVVDFTIKYRVRKGGKLKLKKMNGVYDTKTGTAYFGEDTKAEELTNTINAVLNTINFYHDMMELNHEVIETAQEVISYLE